MAVLSASWSGFAGILSPTNIALLCAFLCLALTGIGSLFRGIPVLIISAIAVFTGLAIWQAVDQIPDSYLLSRFRLFSYGTTSNALDRGFDNYIKLMFNLVILAAVVLGVSRRSPSVLAKIPLAFALGVIVSGLVGLSDYYGITHLRETLFSGTVVADGRATGLTAHPNSLAISAAMALPVGIAHWNRRPAGLLLAVAGNLILLAAILVSGSRSGLIAGVATLLLTMILHPGARQLRVPCLLLSMVSAPLWLGPLMKLVERLLSGERVTGASAGLTEGSDIGRRLLLEQGIRDFEYSPIRGIGYPYMTAAHEVHVQILASLGILGLLGFLLVAICVIQGLMRNYRSMDRVAWTFLMMICAWQFATLLNNQLLDRFLYVPVMGFIAWSIWTKRDAQAGGDVSE